MAENIQYKDAVFRSYFKNKQRVLSLYRAVSGDNSLTEEDIELNDLAEALVNGKRNDVSFMEEHRQEVVDMFAEEWNIEEAKRVAAEEAAEKTTEKINALNKLLIAAKRFVDLEKAANDVDFQNKLIKELLPA